MGNGVINIIVVVLVAACIWLYILWKNSRRMHDTINLVAQQQDLVRHDERARKLCRAIHILNPDFTVGVDYFIGHDAPGQEPYITEWMSGLSRPTEAEITAALQEISDIHHEAKYAAKRRTEYPGVGEQLDAAYQARQGNNAKQLELDEKIGAIKQKYPKTDECI